MDWLGLQRQRNKEKGILDDGEDEYAELVLDTSAKALDVKGTNKLVTPLKVFVYGTLKKGFGNNIYLKNSTYIGSCWVDGFTMMHLGGIPAVFRSEGACWRVRGEVYEVDTATLYALDRLEGVPNHYEREIVDCATFGMAYVYTYKNPEKRNIKTYKRVISGEWVGMSTPYIEVTLGGKVEDGKYADKRGNPSVVSPIRRFGERPRDVHGVLGPHRSEEGRVPALYVPPAPYSYKPPDPIPKGVPAIDHAGFADVSEMTEPSQMCD